MISCAWPASAPKRLSAATTCGLYCAGQVREQLVAQPIAREIELAIRRVFAIGLVERAQVSQHV